MCVGIYIFAHSKSVKVEQPRLVELVEGLGVFLPAHQLLRAIRASKQSASALLRQLMDLLFTEEELATCSVRGKGKRPGLPEQKVEAAMGMYTPNPLPLSLFLLSLPSSPLPFLDPSLSCLHSSPPSIPLSFLPLSLPLPLSCSL